ncbi:hypothetical protein [Ensifer sp. OV372]|uniref:hypothetical protein n=1 Tax=Ensifer sp. OV372 TaxID=1855293 RepID=UPI0008F0CA1F|nr:hypothetical protein [Ensifer sp. OV372]SFH22970.1 hypothetical protein SAMN05216459_1218 [Ensifer sp. OV372]
MTGQETYIATETYNVALDQLENIARTFDPAAPDMMRTRIIEALGDLGIWPMTAFAGADQGRVIVVA